MKFSENWLREWVNPPISTAELSAQLTMAGLEVDAIEPVAGDFIHVVVGEVLAVQPHPDADKLRVCQVNVGQTEALTIVCGASNVAVGMKVPTALIGATLPGNIQIKKSKLRGVESFGMLCSAKELGLAEQSEGLYALPESALPGQDVRDVLQLNDVCITLGLTPNRGDCLSVAGVAREVAVLNRMSVIMPQMQPVISSNNSTIPVTVSASVACPRYCGRVIRGINPGAITPLWLQEKLRRSGLRSLGPIVDVTNYVLLELGQPLHAFDLHKLSGGIHVRHAKSGESLVLLNGSNVTLNANTLIIADDKKPVAMAGIMGGEETSVTSSTVDIFLESAHFSPAALAGKAREYGLHTDSSHRFERGVSAILPHVALERATQLIQMITGGEVGPVIEVADTDKLPKREPIKLRQQRINRVLGIEVSPKDVTDILNSLQMQLASTETGWSVAAPAHRFDISIEEDLIEEIARVKGYNNLLTKPSLQSALYMVNLPEAVTPVRRLKQHLVALGYQEVVTYSFVDSKLQSLLNPEVKAVPLANPIASDMAVMRTNLWPSLVQVLLYNLNRQQDRLMLFECGLRYTSQPPDYNQVMMLSGLLYGPTVPKQWGQEVRLCDFYDAKGHIESLYLLGSGLPGLEFCAEKHPALHPGKSARISVNGRAIGWIGVVNPVVAKTLDIDQEVVLFELEIDALTHGTVPKYREVSKFPAIHRDISMIVDKQISGQTIVECVKKAASQILRDVELFDVYTGEGIDSGRKSIAMGLTLQDLSRTLTDSEVEDVMQRIVGQLQTDLGASLRQ